ncbi:MAG TPA: hypothetical protein VF168_00665 [Trueperaceae bacterium]
MARDYWLNLPVHDLTRARRFFTDIGLAFDADPSTPPDMAALRIGQDQMPIMLVQEERFRHFAAIDAVHAGHELLVTIGVASKTEVDEVIDRVEAAGGQVFGRPSGDERMYGAGFIDLDGHRWNLLFMGG